MTRALWFGLVGFLAGVLVVGAVVVLRPGAPDGAAEPGPAGEGTTRYHCPMHPTYVSDVPGECPICGMRLVPMQDDTVGTPSEAPETTRYHCPMHPSYVSDEPGECPICHMKLVPIEEEAATTMDGMSPPPPGYAAVNIPLDKQRRIGVRTAPAERRVLTREFETVAIVAYDESALSSLNTKVAGWIEALHVDRTGQRVRRGEPLLAIFSPELVAAQEELLVATGHLERLQRAGALPHAIEQAASLLADARRRLELWDVTPDQIGALESSGEVRRTITLFAPAGGYVVEKSAVLGEEVTAGENLYRIADLSTVWVLAQVYEQDLPRVRRGLAARVTLAGDPDLTLDGKVDYVYPYLNPETRTVDVRVVVPNRDGALRPGMYAKVRFLEAGGAPSLVVLNEAILDTGERRIAFVRHPDGTFEPRELTVGRRTREGTEVLSGISEGETIVVSGNFLIDSESRLKAALSGMSSGHRHGG